jgi:hypothetical protein
MSILKYANYIKFKITKIFFYLSVANKLYYTSFNKLNKINIIKLLYNYLKF